MTDEKPAAMSDQATQARTMANRFRGWKAGLRLTPKDLDQVSELCGSIADEIDRLRAELADLDEMIAGLNGGMRHYEAEVTKLRAELQAADEAQALALTRWKECDDLRRKNLAQIASLEAEVARLRGALRAVLSLLPPGTAVDENGLVYTGIKPASGEKGEG